MKPVNKGGAPDAFSRHGEAKRHLAARIGEHCSYCEMGAAAKLLDVEHIYPMKPHPKLALSWRNFLLACKTCNTYKSKHLGNDRQKGLWKRFLWPHHENTFRAFEYHSDGRVEVRSGLPPHVETAALATRKMSGLMSSPAVASDYDDLGVAYDGISIRKEAWETATEARVNYLASPTSGWSVAIANIATKIGHFSIWMEVFHDRVEVRRELIRAFKADPNCFDANTQPLVKGRH